jgi:hypothetical protein
MDIQNKYCINCGENYRYQASGNPVLSYLGQNKDYCPECSFAISSSLSKIEKKTEVVWIDTDEITVDELMKHDLSLGYTCRVYIELFDPETEEHSTTSECIVNNTIYWYRFYPSKKSEAIIKKKVRKCLRTGKILDNEKS